MKKKKLIGVEVLWWYDGIAYRLDDDWQRYSVKKKKPIWGNELCRLWRIYKVVKVWEYDYNILDVREDK